MTQIYCTAPFNGLTVREDGHVRTCCAGEISIGNLNRDSIEDLINSPTLQEIQRSLINNKAHENCLGCVELETTSGVASIRQHYLKFYPRHGPDHFELKSFDLRWNNSCNLACMYCSPTFSSTWADRLNISNASPVKNYQDDLLKFVLQHVDEIDEITLVGGEPMLMKQNYALIDQLPDHSRISIITNLSYDLERLPCMPNLLRRPRNNTIWNISCENINQQFEYVRSGASWQQIETNLKFLVDNWADNVVIILVYSSFSAFDLVETMRYFGQLGVKKFQFQTYFGLPAIDVFSMPVAMQLMAKQQLDQVEKNHFEHIHPEDRDFYPLSNLELLQAKLSECQSAGTVTKAQFYEQIAWYDQWSTTKFKDLWPHVIDLVELHLE